MPYSIFFRKRYHKSTSNSLEPVPIRRVYQKYKKLEIGITLSSHNGGWAIGKFLVLVAMAACRSFAIVQLEYFVAGVE